jgi:hypothetical protein
MAFLQQQKNGLEKRVKELEAANLELMVQLDIVHKKEQPLSISGGMSGIPDFKSVTLKGLVDFFSIVDGIISLHH